VAPNTVTEVLQKGYQLREHLLRPARVMVAKAPEADKENTGETSD
jgi:molecular chaperone GrpE